MNAHALLTSQGWLGTGHALDSRFEPYYGPTYNQKGKRGLAYDPSAQNQNLTTGNGLVKPLLVSQRHGSRYGLGKKAHEPQSGNQWWLKGFQSALDNIGKSESERTSGTSTPDTGSVYTGKTAGLYGYFVKGQLMSGTIGEDEVISDDLAAKVKRKSKKRKSDALEEDNGTMQSKMDPLAVSPVKRPQTAKELEVSIPYLEERDKTRKLAHRRAQSTAEHEQQFAVMSEWFGAAEGATKKEKKKSKILEETGAADLNGEDSPSSRMEETTSKDHRTQRKRQKEEKQGFKLLLAQMMQEEMAKLSSMEDTDDQDHEEERTGKPSKPKTKRKPRKAT